MQPVFTAQAPTVHTTAAATHEVMTGSVEHGAENLPSAEVVVQENPLPSATSATISGRYSPR